MDKRIINYVGIVGPILILLMTFGFMYNTVWADDHFMTLRYAENFANGCGIAYNCETPDEGASSLMLIATIGISYMFTGINLYFLAKFVPFLFSILLLFLLYEFLNNYIKDKGFITIVLLFIFVDVNMLMYSVLGTSNPIFQASLFTTILFLFSREKIKGIPMYYVPLIVHIYTRPEGLITLFAILLYEGFYGIIKGKREHQINIGFLVALMIIFFYSKLLLFGSIQSPPAIRKLSSLDGVTLQMFFSNLMNIVRTYIYLVPGIIVFFINKENWKEQQNLVIFSFLFICGHIFIRTTVLPDVGRYFNQVSILIYVIAFLGYYQMYKSLSEVKNIFPLLVVAWVIFAFFSVGQIIEHKEQLDSTPVFFAYKPAGEFMKEHTTEDAIVSSVEVGAPAYYSHRQFYDTSGLTNYENARIWKQNSELFLEQKINYYQLLEYPPEQIYTLPELQIYYNRFFNVSPDMIFMIHNPPSYVLGIHPKFQEQYREVWRRTRQDNFRGYYAVFAKINSTKVRGI